jgi:hypothetical protein
LEGEVHMSRSHRRRFEKTIPGILERAGRHCGLCGTQFEHNANVFAGFSRKDRVVLTGECCRPVLFSVHATGTYSAGNARPVQMTRTQLQLQLESWVPTDDAFESSPGQSDDPLARLKPAPPASPMTQAQAEPWKTDDANWFTDNPARAHRLRAAYDEELAALSAPHKREGLAQGYSWEMLVRQVGKGRCVRLAFCRDTLATVPDVEEVIRDIFDAVSRPGASGFIHTQEVAEIVRGHQLDCSVDVA